MARGLTLLDRWPGWPRGLSTAGAAAFILALVTLTYLEIGAPPTVTTSALALVPTLAAAALLPDLLVGAVLLAAVACQGTLAMTGCLTPLAAAAESAAVLAAAGVGRLTACCALGIQAHRAVDEMTEAALAGRPAGDTLATVARRARSLLRGDAAAVVVEGARGDLLKVVARAGPGNPRFAGLTFPRAGSVSGRVMDAGAAVLLPRLDAAAAAGEPLLHDHVGGWALFVPLPGEGRCLGALVVAGRSGGMPLWPSRTPIADSLAATASLVILHAAGQEDRRGVAVLEDRARIARELHDGVIQSLLAVGAVIQLVRSSAMPAPDAAERLDLCAKTLDESVDDLRHYVLGLHPPRARERPLADVLQAMVEQTRARTGLDARIEAEAEALAAAEPAAPDVTQMVREGLSNVERHATATLCRVRLYLAGGSLVIEVADDGHGPDAARRVGGLGLANIRWRATRLGGVTQLHGGGGHGTTLRVTLPFPQPQAV